MASPLRNNVPLLLLSLLAAASAGAWLYLREREATAVTTSVAVVEDPAPAVPPVAFQPVPIGLPVEGRPVIPHLAVFDLDADGLLDVLVCDAAANRIGWIRQSPRGEFTETAISDRIPAPVRVVPCDLNQDQRPDLLVASAGSLQPTEDRIGRVVALENLGENQFRPRVLAENLHRVNDVRVADLNADGRLDIVAAQAGIKQGALSWLENRGDWTFTPHAFATGAVVAAVGLPGAAKPAEFALLRTGSRPGVQRIRRAAEGEWHEAVVWTPEALPWRGSGMEPCDLNRDGVPVLLVANGDGSNPDFAAPARGDGLQWLETRGGSFEFHRIGDLPGCYSPVAADLDADGDTDLVSVSAYSHAIDPDVVGLMAWINDGRQHFTPVVLAQDPARLMALAVGDLDGTGAPVLVTGGFHAYPPFSRMSRVTLWRQVPPAAP